MSNWIDNLIRYEKKHEIGQCPVCGGENVSANEDVVRGRKSLTFICAACGDKAHFNGRLESEI